MQKPSRSHTVVVISLIMGWMFLFGMVSTGLIGPNRSSIESEYRLNHTLFGLGVGGIQFLCAFIVLLTVPYLRALRSVNALILSLITQSVGFALVWLTHSIAGLIFGWTGIMLGVVLGSITNTMSAQLFAGNPRRGVILLHGFNGLGKLCGPLLAAGCFMLGWRWSFGAVGFATAALLLAFVALRNRFTKLDEMTSQPQPRLRLELLRKPFYWLCILPFAFIAGSEQAFFSLLPLFYEQQHGLSPGEASLLMTVHLAGLVVGRFAFVPFGRRLTNNWILGICLLSGVFAVPALLSDSYAVWLFCLFVSGGVFSSTWPVFYDQASTFLAGRTEMLDYGSALGNTLGISSCIYLSSRIADVNLIAAMFFALAIMGCFALVYYLSPLSKGGKPILESPDGF